MRRAILVAAAAAVVCASATVPTLTEADVFSAWQTQYQKSYSTADEAALRFAIFRVNLAKVAAHNAGADEWTMAMNEFGDLTQREFAMARIGGYKAPKLRRPLNLAPDAPKAALPQSVDWTTKGVVTPVKNQGQCGSCWAFSSTGAMESINAINGKGLKSLSEQQLVDCATPFGTEGCNGGWMDDAFAYTISNKGLCSEAAYPYRAVDGTCKASSCTNVVSISSFTDVKPNSDLAFATAVVQQPVSIVVEADQSSFQFYSSGVLTAPCGTVQDHAILTVGYGTLNGVEYFKVKNSWGAAWGMSGYILLARGEQYNGGAGQCGLYSKPSYPNQ